MVLTPEAFLATDDRMASHQSAPRGPWRRFWRNRIARVSLALLCIVGLLAVLAPLLVRFHVVPSPYDIGASRPNAGPSRTHILGVDHLGRDLLARTLYGARVSLSIALLAQAVAVVVGGAVGLIAGYYGGRLDNLLMRLTDVVYAFPGLLFVLFVATVLGPGYWNMLITVVVVGWPFVARLVRAEVLSIKQRDFIEAARATGARSSHIVVRHIVPHAVGPVAVTVAFGIPSVIFFEAFLSYLGVGMRPPTPSWGAMISTGYQTMSAYPHQILVPAAAISVVTLAFNFIGDGLRDAFDPRRED